MIREKNSPLYLILVFHLFDDIIITYYYHYYIPLPNILFIVYILSHKIVCLLHYSLITLN